MKGTILFVCSFISIVCLTVDSVHSSGVPGKCPHIDYVKGFIPSKMTGKWYSIYQTGEQQSCLFFEFEQATPGHYHGYYYHLNASVALNPKDADIVGEGYVVTAKFHPELDKVLVKTFASDYDNYAGIYTCKEEGDVHFPEFALWSRTKTLDEKHIVEMKEILSKYDSVDVNQLKAVNNENCPYGIVD